MTEPDEHEDAGVWALCDTDYGETITAVYAEELEALRVVNGRGYGRVRFLPFGMDLRELDAREAARS